MVVFATCFFLHILFIHVSFSYAHHSPYKISKTDADVFSTELQRLGLDKAASAASEAVQKMDTTKSTSEGKQTI